MSRGNDPGEIPRGWTCCPHCRRMSPLEAPWGWPCTCGLYNLITDDWLHVVGDKWLVTNDWLQMIGYKRDLSMYGFWSQNRFYIRQACTFVWGHGWISWRPIPTHFLRCYNCDKVRHGQRLRRWWCAMFCQSKPEWNTFWKHILGTRSILFWK